MFKYQLVKSNIIKEREGKSCNLTPFRIWEDVTCIFPDKSIPIGKIQSANFVNGRLTIITKDGEFIFEKKALREI